MAGVPDEHDDMAGDIIEHKTPETAMRPVVRVDIDVPDGVELRLTINGIDVELGD
jgi:hypothetical protein